MKSEPAVAVASIMALVAAVITLLVAFGLNLSDDQQKAILGVVAVAAPILSGLFTRPKVKPAGE